MRGISQRGTALCVEQKPTLEVVQRADTVATLRLGQCWTACAISGRWEVDPKEVEKGHLEKEAKEESRPSRCQPGRMDLLRRCGQRLKTPSLSQKQKVKAKVTVRAPKRKTRRTLTTLVFPQPTGILTRPSGKSSSNSRSSTKTAWPPWRKRYSMLRHQAAGGGACWHLGADSRANLRARGRKT